MYLSRLRSDYVAPSIGKCRRNQNVPYPNKHFTAMRPIHFLAMRQLTENDCWMHSYASRKILDLLLRIEWSHSGDEVVHLTFINQNTFGKQIRTFFDIVLVFKSNSPI